MQSNNAYKKRLLAILTSLTLIFTMSFSTITTFAAEEDQGVVTENEQQIDEQTPEESEGIAPEDVTAGGEEEVEINAFENEAPDLSWITGFTTPVTFVSFDEEADTVYYTADAALTFDAEGNTAINYTVGGGQQGKSGAVILTEAGAATEATVATTTDGNKNLTDTISGLEKGTTYKWYCEKGAKHNTWELAHNVVITFSTEAEAAPTGLNGGDVVSADGEYTLAEGATGTITIGEGLKVKIVGNNYDAETNSFPTGYTDLNIVVGAGSELTIQDLYVNVAEDAKSIIDFAGTGKLIVSGHNLLDRPDGYGSNATIHVGPDADVTFDGDGYLWGYKHAAGSYIGSNANEVCGNVTFNGGTYMFKASKTGALIGQDSSDPATGKITINGGTIYLKAVARGSLLGASAQGQAPDVIVNGGQIEFVTDWMGAAIGSANAAKAGNLTVNGGSIRTIVTQNAWSNGHWATGIDTETAKGAVLTDANITAAHNTKMLAFDATKYASADKISVYLDGADTPFYEGGLYEFCTNEIKNPETPYANATMCNWLPNTSEFALNAESEYSGAYPVDNGSQLAGDNTLVFQFAKENHLFTVNGDQYIAFYDEEANAFTYYEIAKVEAKEAACEEAGNIEYWTDADNNIYVTFDEEGTATVVTAEAVVIPAAGHQFGEDGICTVCGKLNPDIAEFTVKTVDDLKLIANEVNGGNDLAGVTVTLANDIDLGSEAWTPIGNSSKAFAGTFDGAGYTISGLVTGATTGYGALFGNNSGTVKDVTVEGQYGTAEAPMSVRGDCFAGAVAYNTGTVEGVIANVTMNLTGGDGYAVGGVVGRNAGGTVIKCGNEGSITCDSSKSFYRVGGVVGHLQNNGTISECYNKARIEAWNYKNGCQGVGGILGSLDSNGTVSYCYNTGDVFNGYGDSATGGKQGTGGIVGAINAGSVDHCYAVGETHAPASSGIIIGKVGNGTYDNLYSLNTARAYNQYGTKTDTEHTWGTYTNIKYCDGTDENADGTIKFGGAAIARDYNPGYSITNSYTKSEAEMVDPAFAALLGDKFQAQCGYPALAWEEPKAHVEGEAQDTETVPATYDEGDYHYSVTLCTECGLELSRSDKIYTSGSLAEQAADAAKAAEEAQATAEDLAKKAAETTGEDKAIAAQEALDAAKAAEEAAKAAKAAAQTALDAAETEEQIAEAEGAVSAANTAIETATAAAAVADEAAVEALEEANTIKELKDSATVSEATLNSTVDEDLYKPASYAVYKDAIDAFNDVVRSGSATKQQVIDARSAITKAYVNLEMKDSISGAEVTGLSAVTYTGKAFTPEPVVTLDGAALTVDTDYTVSYDKNTNAGTAIVTVTGAGDYMDSAVGTFTIDKAAQKMTASPVAKTVKFKKVKKAKQTVTGAITVKNAAGKVTYAKKSGSAKLSINSAGTVTVKKKTKKGTYKMVVNVKAAGNANYKPMTKAVTISVKVK